MHREMILGLPTEMTANFSPERDESNELLCGRFHSLLILIKCLSQTFPTSESLFG